MTQKLLHAITSCVILLLVAASLVNCGADKGGPKECLDCPIDLRLKPADVLTNLRRSYRKRDSAEYAKLLADDFQFWLDPATRPAGVPEVWTRLMDSTLTGCLFSAGVDIRITLTFDSLDKPDPIANHAGWRKILVTNTFLEVDYESTGGVGYDPRFRVSGDEQQFYFRKGRTPADSPP